MLAPIIFVNQAEFDFSTAFFEDDSKFKLNSGTSTMKQKAFFFETLKSIGKIRSFSIRDTEANGDMAKTLLKENTFVASFHEPPPNLPCRLLQHTKGGLMLPGGFLNGWTFRKGTINLVQTTRQKHQLENAFSKSDIAVGVFGQRLSTHFFQLPNAEQSLTPYSASSLTGPRLVYAGRIIPNKGISQLVRCLNIWPISGAKLTIIGDYEPDFPISQSGGYCAGFERWFEREVIKRNQTVSLHFEPPLPQASLVKHFWASDIFLYPSFHEDESLGNAAHEAVLSGIPAIVTDWCGLGHLGRNTRGGALPTYATLGGVRYSLLALSKRISSLALKINCSEKKIALADSDWVKATFDSHRMKASLERSISDLLQRKPEEAPKGGWRCPSRLTRLANNGPAKVREALSYASTSDPEGLYVDGSGYQQDDYSEARFLTAIQSFYTTWASPPRLKIGVELHGFWRIGLLDYERAIIEFGFPGPRLLRFTETEWQAVCSSVQIFALGEIHFKIRDETSIKVLQRAVDLGYLVPNDLNTCDLPPPNDTLPKDWV